MDFRPRHDKKPAGIARRARRVVEASARGYSALTSTRRFLPLLGLLGSTSTSSP